VATINLAINGRPYTVEADPQISLLTVLRENLDLEPNTAAERASVAPAPSWSMGGPNGLASREPKTSRKSRSPPLKVLRAAGARGQAPGQGALDPRRGVHVGLFPPCWRH
jgi:hypothetical protein